jgi:hypothetical protein
MNILGCFRCTSRQLGHLDPFNVRFTIAVCQDCPHNLHTHHACLSLPQLTSAMERSFLFSSHSDTRSGRCTITLPRLSFPLHFRAHSGQLLPTEERLFGVADHTHPHPGLEHLHLCFFLLLPSATSEGEGLSSCHSAARRLSVATERQLQNDLLLSQAGHTMVPPSWVRANALAFHSWTSPHFGQPLHCSQTLHVEPWEMSLGDLERLFKGCHSFEMPG